jgi:hypothetical protein
VLSGVFLVFDLFAIGKAGRAAIGEMAAAMRTGRRQGARAALTTVLADARELLRKNLTKHVLEEAMTQAVAETAVMGALNVLLPLVIEPVLTEWIRHRAVEHGTPDEVSAVDAALRSIDAVLSSRPDSGKAP